MYNNTEYYQTLILAWQESTDRREAHRKACRRLYEMQYRTFMSQIRYVKQKGIALKPLGLPHTDWAHLRAIFGTQD